ncbi:MAG: undecaprenyldiphospho-muramoylpentapeptide beta-N-acetylglucosaminyltransferase [Bacteriovoracia bacterium]
MTASGKPTLLVAGGGTGGHVLAGVAIAQAWRQKFGADAPVVFVGARGKIEEKLVPREGFPLRLLDLGSLNRVSVSRKLKTYFQLPWSFIVSLRVLLSERPSAVIGVGGYASGPVVLMAGVFSWLVGARTALLEQNSVPGMTNRILARFVRTVFLAFDLARLPQGNQYFAPEKLRVTGNPIRNSLSQLPSAARDPFVVFIFGGSQGAHGINTLVLSALPHLKDKPIQFIHQTGEKDFDRVSRGYQAAGIANARVEKFIYEMPAAYRASSLIICRSGSSTMAEIAAVGRAAIFIPLPTAADNHQEWNARLFADAGAARLVHQEQTSGEDLARMIEEFRANPAEISRIEQKVRDYHRPDAARDIVDAITT